MLSEQFLRTGRIEFGEGPKDQFGVNLIVEFQRPGQCGICVHLSPCAPCKIVRLGHDCGEGIEGDPLQVEDFTGERIVVFTICAAPCFHGSGDFLCIRLFQPDYEALPAFESVRGKDAFCAGGGVAFETVRCFGCSFLFYALIGRVIRHPSASRTSDKADGRGGEDGGESHGGIRPRRRGRGKRFPEINHL